MVLGVVCPDWHIHAFEHIIRCFRPTGIIVVKCMVLNAERVGFHIMDLNVASADCPTHSLRPCACIKRSVC